MGRLLLDTPAGNGQTRAEVILDALDRGAYLRDAAEVGRIGYSTLRGYLRTGRDALARSEEHGGDAKAAGLSQTDLRLMEFARDADAAGATVTMRCLSVIQAAAEEGKWQAAAWYLERRYPERWGRGPREVEEPHSEMSAEEARRRLSGLPEGPLWELHGEGGEE